MATIAVMGLKGGVGKTSLAVNIGWAAATLSSRRTLLWDLDGQAAASFVLRGAPPGGRAAAELIRGEVSPRKMVVETIWPRLSVLPADASLHGLDALFAEVDRKKRVQRVAEELARGFDRVIVDCPPGLGPTSRQVLRAADAIVLPLIPSALSRRAFEEVREQVADTSRRPALLPVFTLVDRRRAGHLAALAAEPDWPVMPAASIVEQMGERRAPLGAYAPRAPAAEAVRDLWLRIERALTGGRNKP